MNQTSIRTVDHHRWDGLQRQINPLVAPFSEPRVMINWTSQLLLAKTARTGYSQFKDTPDSYAVLAIIDVAEPDGTNYLLRVTTHTISRLDLTTNPGTWGSAVYTFATPITQVDSAYFYGSVYLCTDTNNLLKSGDGTTWSYETVAGLLQHKPRYCTVYQERLYLANFVDKTTAAPLGSYMVASAIGADSSGVVSWVNNNEDAESAQYYNIDTDFNGSIQDLSVVNNRLQIKKGGATGRMSVYRFDGETEVVQVPTTNSIRPGGHQTVAMIEGVEYFTNNQGIYENQGDKPRLKSKAYGSELSGTFVPLAGGATDTTYLCSLNQTLTVEDRSLAHPILIYDALAHEFSFWDTAHKMTCFGYFATSSSGQRYLYSGDETGNTWIWNGANTDGGSTIFADLETRPFFGDQFTNPMDIDKVWFFADPGVGLKFSLRPAGELDWAEEVESTGFATVMGFDRSGVYGVSYRVTSDTTGERPVFLGASPYFKENPTV